jgi:UDP:flavonoid glycosyltransferase YjiC (YdhE family)
MTGLAALQFIIGWIRRETLTFFSELPEVLRAGKVEALLIDQMTPCGSVADMLNIPFITVCNALLLHREPRVPPSITGWSYSEAWWARLRNQMGYFFGLMMINPFWEIISEQRRQWNLPPYIRWEDVDSQLAQICQLPEEFDFPRVNLPKCFHYTGPLQDPSGLEPLSFPSIPFPFEKLTGEPIIYASLGTFQNRKTEIFYKIAEACVGLKAQLVISLGDPNSKEICSGLPGSPIVVPYAPHQQLIERSSLVITHAGMNTTLGALSSGVPLVAIPISHEQPGIAARIARTGTGKILSLAKLNVARLNESVRQVFVEDSYKKNALRLKESIRRAGGVRRAADIVERSIATVTLAFPC